jgi:outer membrane protein assembly factor BamB
MNSGQLNLVLIALLSGIAGGFLLLLLRPPASVEVAKRITDIAAETAAGTLSGSGQAGLPAEKTDIKGVFESFDGKPGKPSSAWPRFRGADFNNIALESGSLAESWGSGGPPVLWRIGLSEGHGGPAVWNGRMYLMDYDEAKESDALRCFSLDDGKEIWRRSYRSPAKRNHGVSRTVPAVTAEHTVTMGPRCHVLCVETQTGAFVWGIDLVAEYGADVPLWYTGQCPLIDDGVAVLAPGGKALMIGVE